MPSPLPSIDKSELKDKSQFRYIGKPMPRRDTPLKVNGTAKYAIDVDLPGMVYATVRHSPVHGGTPESWNDAKVKSMRGVLGTVRLPDGVAVLADSLPHALAARQALEVKWKKGAAEGFDSEKNLQRDLRQGSFRSRTRRPRRSIPRATRRAPSAPRRRPTRPSTSATTATTRRWSR